MNKLGKDLKEMLEKLEELYYKTEDKTEREKLVIFHKNMSNKFEKIVRAQFDKNDSYYKKVIKKMRETNEQIKKHLETQLQVVELFKYLSEFSEQLDSVFFGWSRKNE